MDKYPPFLRHMGFKVMCGAFFCHQALMAQGQLELLYKIHQHQKAIKELIEGSKKGNVQDTTY